MRASPVSQYEFYFAILTPVAMLQEARKEQTNKDNVQPVIHIVASLNTLHEK